MRKQEAAKVCVDSQGPHCGPAARRGLGLREDPKSDFASMMPLQMLCMESKEGWHGLGVRKESLPSK